MADKNPNSLFFDGAKLTPNRAAWNREIKKLFRRAKSWEKQGIAFTDFPSRPQKVTKADIKAIKDIRKKNLTNIDQYQVQFVREHPELTFEDVNKYSYHGAPVVAWGEMHKFDLPMLNLADYPELWDMEYEQYRNNRYKYDPPTESDYYEDDYPEPESPPKTSSSSTPVVTAAEIEAHLDDIIRDCTQYEDNITPSPYLSATEYRKKIASDYAELIRGAIDNIRDQSFKTKQAFYEYLQRPGVVQKLQEIANRIYACYEKDGSPQRNRLLAEFMETLNMGVPLTDYQYAVLQDTGQMEFDFEEFDEE